MILDIMTDDSFMNYLLTAITAITASIGFPALWRFYFQNKTDQAKMQFDSHKAEKESYENDQDALKLIINKQKLEIDHQHVVIQKLMLQQELLISSLDMMLAVIEGELANSNSLAAIGKIKDLLSTIKKSKTEN